MGVSGCGKTTFAQEFSKKLRIDFLEGDSLHTKSNIDKMRNGIPLTDSDRWPWLQNIKEEIITTIKYNSDLIISCSSLKQSYRDFLQKNIPQKIKWIYLKGNYDLIYSRLKERQNHFFKEEMLQSQFNTLEEPTNAITLNIDKSVKDNLDKLLKKLEI